MPCNPAQNMAASRSTLLVRLTVLVCASYSPSCKSTFGTAPLAYSRANLSVHVPDMDTVLQDADHARTCIKKLAWPNECAEAGPSASKNFTVVASAAQRHPGEAAAAPPQHHEAGTGTAKAAGSFPLNSLPSDLLLQVLLPVGSAELLRLSQVPVARQCQCSRDCVYHQMSDA